MRFPWITKKATQVKRFDWENFDRFSYSKHSHIALFAQHHYEEELYGEKKDVNSWGLKRYDDLLVFSFIKEMIPPGSKLLDIGGGKSRIIRYFKYQYECWNIDKLAGLGQGPIGPTSIDTTGYRLVRDYIGNFNPELPPNYFDFVFSISALEHVPGSNPQVLENILTDINRVLKPGCYSLHCFDSVLKPDGLWVNNLLHYIFKHEKTFNRLIPYEEISQDKDLFELPEEKFNRNWRRLSGKEYKEYGRPFSYNVLWKKSGKKLDCPLILHHSCSLK